MGPRASLKISRILAGNRTPAVYASWVREVAACFCMFSWTPNHFMKYYLNKCHPINC
jgi:hypothetical protein